MDAAIRVLRIVQMAFILSVIMYAGLAEFVFGGRVQPEPNVVLFNVFVFAASAAILAGFFVRQHFLRRAAAGLQGSANAEEGVSAFRMAHFLSLTFAESVGLFGFVLRSVGFDMKYTIPFFIVSFALLLIWGPRKLEVA